jgi:dolichol-phosphate mannosyltransferase
MKSLALIPALNVAGRVGDVIRRIPGQEVELTLLIDDGSTDGTADVARDAGATVVSHASNRGVGAAIRTGIEYARDHGYEGIIVLNALGKFDPADLGSILQPLKEGQADLVQGSRFVAGGSLHGIPFKRLIGTKGYSFVFSTLLGHSVSDASSGIRAFRTALADSPGIDLNQPWLDRYELEPYLLYRTIACGYRVVEVPMTIHYPPGPRSAYTRMRPVQDWWHLARPLFSLAADRLKGDVKKVR